MQDHLEHRLMLKTQPAFRSLYEWAIIEVDDAGTQVGEDQIPWPWTLYFEASSVEIIDSTEFKSPGIEQDKKMFEISDRKFIKLKLVPTTFSRGADRWSDIHYSMFGTDRYIEDFQLEIMPLKDPSDQERCFAWGVASYSYELEFRDELQADTLKFSLFVDLDRFDNYRNIISGGQVRKIIFRIGAVKGFYSAWSPETSTSRIKVLTAGSQQSVISSGEIFELYRLGLVTDAQISMVRGFDLNIRRSESDENT